MKRNPDEVSRRGVAIVEMAIVLPLLVLLLLGGIDLALQFYVRHTMVNAAREAARALAVRGATETDVEQRFKAQLESAIDADFTVDATDATPPGETDVSVRVSVPLADVSLGIVPSSATDIIVQTTMRKEQ